MQIGARAIRRDDEALRAVKLEQCNAIVAWWRNQPDDVVEAMLDAMRRRDEGAVQITEEETGTSGIELLAALVADDDLNDGRSTYEHVIRDQLNAVRAANAADEEGEAPAVRAALTGLDDDEISATVGTAAVTEYTAHHKRVAYAEAREIVAEWEHRAWGPRAIEELVAALERTHGAEVARATRDSAGGPAADLVEIIRDEATRALYARLVTRIAGANTTS